MRTPIALLLCLLLYAASASAEESLPLEWSNDLAAARLQATEEGKRVFVLFTTPSCGYCHRLKREVLRHPSLQIWLRPFVLVEVNAQTDPEAALHYGARAFPYMVVLSAKGDRIAHVSGFMPRKPFLEWLQQATGEAPAFAQRKEKLVQLLQQQRLNPEEQTWIRETMTDPALGEMARRMIRQRHPFPAQLIVEGLADKRLAHRIACLEILEERTGEAKGFDPWAPSEKERADGLNQWRAWAESEAAYRSAKSVHVSLSEDEIRRLLLRLDADDSRADKACRTLLILGKSESGRTGVRRVIASIREQDDLSPLLDANLRWIDWTLFLAEHRPEDAAMLARLLVFGKQDARIQTLKKISEILGSRSEPLLADCLDDADPAMRECAVELLSQRKTPHAATLLMARLGADTGSQVETDHNVMITIFKALQALKVQEAQPLLLQYVGEEEELSVTALEALQTCGSDQSKALLETVERALDHPSWRVQVGAMQLIGAKDLRPLVPKVRPLLESDDSYLVEMAIKVLAKFKDQQSMQKLRTLFKEKDALKPAILRAFIAMNELAALSNNIYDEVKDAPVDLRAEVGSVLAGGRDRNRLLPFLRDPEHEVVAATVLSMGTNMPYNNDAQNQIREMLIQTGKKHPHRLVRIAICRALRERTDAVGTTDAELAQEDQGSSAQGHSLNSNPRAQAFRKDLLLAFGLDPEKEAAQSYQIPAWKQELLAKFDDPQMRARILRMSDDMNPQMDDSEPTASASHKAMRNLLAEWAGEKDLDLAMEAALTLAEYGYSESCAIFRKHWNALDLGRKKQVALALANPAGTASLDLLSELLASEESSLSKAAFSSLPSHRGTRAIEMLLAQKDEVEPRVFLEGLSRFLRQPNQKTHHAHQMLRTWIRQALTSSDANTRHHGLMVGSWAQYKNITAPALAALESENEFHRRSGLITLWMLQPDIARMQASRFAKDPSPWVRQVVVFMLTNPDNSQNARHMLNADTSLYFYSSSTFSNEAERPAITPEIQTTLESLAQDPDPMIRLYASVGLLDAGLPVDFMRMAQDVRSTEDFRRYDLVRSLRTIDLRAYPDALPLIEVFLQSESASERQAMQELIANTDASFAKRLQKTDAANQKTPTLAIVFQTQDENKDLTAEATVSAQPARALAYFYKPGCPACHRVEQMVEEVKDIFPDLEVRRFNILDNKSMAYNEALSSMFGIPEKNRLVGPAIFSSMRGLVKSEITLESLTSLAADAAGLPTPWAIIQTKTDAAQTAIVNRYHSIGLPTVLGAGLLDGINPCAFTTIIFLLSYLAYQGHSRQRMLLIGLSFTFAVFLTYYLVGLGFLSVLFQFSAYNWLSKLLYGFTIIFTLAICIFSLFDGIKAWRGQIRESTLQLPDFIKDRIHKVIHRGTSARAGVLAAIFAGVVVSLLELACTGQVYAPTLMLVSRLPGHAWAARTYLLFYNLMFVLPLLVVFIFAYFGLTSQRLVEVFKKHAATVRFATAGLFFAFFILMLHQFLT